jgi:hypothetical protein
LSKKHRDLKTSLLRAVKSPHRNREDSSSSRTVRAARNPSKAGRQSQIAIERLFAIIDRLQFSPTEHNFVTEN